VLTNPLVGDTVRLVTCKSGSGCQMKMLHDLVTLAVLLSIQRAVKLNVPPALGVPLMVPVVVLSVSPFGKLPAAIDHV
jgi:hypothetical protein